MDLDMLLLLLGGVSLWQKVATTIDQIKGWFLPTA
jgi:hypothetical protein